MTSPSVWVIVLNWNAEDDTAACLDSLAAQRDASFGVLLVDNGSADGSGERLQARYPELSYLQTGANLGYAGGNNRGIEWAVDRGAEWVVVLNNDTVADPDCLARLLAAGATAAGVAALAPLIVRHDDPSRVWFAGGRLDRWRGVGVHLHEGEPVERAIPPGDAAAWQACTFLTGCCLLLRVAALREVGSFQADYFAYGEDAELSLRFARAGWALGWVPAARLAHRVPAASAPPSPWQIRMRDRNRRRMVRDWFPVRWRLAFTLWFWPTRCLLLFGYLARGDRARAEAIVAGMRER